MRSAFYSSSEYRDLQRSITTRNWRLGKFDNLKREVIRKCKRKECSKIFSLIPSNPKLYCSSQCSAIENNQGRQLSNVSRAKISKALLGRKNPNKGKILVPRLKKTCSNINCKKIFLYERWKKRKFCSRDCAIKTVGSAITSPKAARAKAGIRLDISPELYFYSRWEANYARLLNLLDVKWVFQPRKFKLIKQNYTPDFYLPEEDTYVEIKKFLSDYSKKRDREFRRLYPRLKLKLILKKDYLQLQDKFASKIETWEYSR